MSPVSSDDKVVIQNVLNGDREAYSVLVRRYQASLIRLCHSLLHTAADAQDAAQEIFVKAYLNLGSFKESSAFYTWLYRIAVNHCLSVLRTRKRRGTESLDKLLQSNPEATEALFAVSETIRSKMAAGELLTALLDSLPANYRIVLLLRESEGMSYEEIAAVMGSSLDSVKALLKRARAEITEKMRHFRPGTGV